MLPNLPALRIMCNQFRYVVEAVVGSLESYAASRSLDQVVFYVRTLVSWQTNADCHRIRLT